MYEPGVFPVTVSVMRDGGNDGYIAIRALEGESATWP